MFCRTSQSSNYPGPSNMNSTASNAGGSLWDNALNAAAQKHQGNQSYMSPSSGYSGKIRPPEPPSRNSPELWRPIKPEGPDLKVLLSLISIWSIYKSSCTCVYSRLVLQVPSIQVISDYRLHRMASWSALVQNKPDTSYKISRYSLQHVLASHKIGKLNGILGIISCLSDLCSLCFCNGHFPRSV